MELLLDSREFDVSPLSGFIPEKPPLERLGSYFKPWDRLVGSLAKLVNCGEIRNAIHDLPVLDHTKLETKEEYLRAHLVLSAISHAYVWCEGEDGAAKVLPKSIAVPWAKVSEHLGILPVLCHHTYLFQNWKVLDKERPLSMENISILVSLTGSETEDAFLKVTFQIELDAATALQEILKAQKAVKECDEIGILRSLDNISKAFSQMTKSFLRMNDVCDPWEFYSRLRVYLGGWKNTKALPEGLLYEGVSSVPLQFSGGSAAESTVFQVLDAALGVEHPRSTAVDDDLPFLERMRSYMLPKHREFITAVRDGPSIKRYVQASQNKELFAKFNNCVDGLKNFRDNHIKVVARFITIQAAKESRMQNSSKNKNLAKQGTGGTGIMPFLKRVRNETCGIRAPMTMPPIGYRIKAKMRKAREWINFAALPTLIILFSIPTWIFFFS